MKNEKIVSRPHAEAEAAAKLTEWMQREFGLLGCAAHAELRRGVLTVLFHDALSPVGRLLSQSEEGRRAIGSVYHILHNAHRTRMHALVSRIVGFPVHRSHWETDAATGQVLLTFQWEETEHERNIA